MLKPKIIVVFSPTIISLISLRIINTGAIYYVASADSIYGFLLEKTKRILRFINIIPFSYRIGIGSFGNGQINSIYKKAGHITEELYKSGSDDKLVKLFSRKFECKKFKQAWNKFVYGKVREIVMNYYGILNNYSSRSTVYVPLKSRESFVIKRLCFNDSGQNLEIKSFINMSTNISFLIVYLVRTIKRFVACGVEFRTKIKTTEFKVMTEAVRYLDEDRAFNILEWWDKCKISKDDILILSLNNKEAGRVASFREARKMGFHCAEVMKKRRIPAKRLRNMVELYLVLPLRSISYLMKSRNIDMFVFFLVFSFYWAVFLSYYKVSTLVLSTEGFEPFFISRFGCSSVMYQLSYTGNFENPLHKYISVNHLLVWGESQVSHTKKWFSVDKLYYTGCHGLSYVERDKRRELMSKLSNIQHGKQNIVFFDNKLHKNGSNPEKTYFRFLGLIIKCSEIFDANVFFRPKSYNPFDSRIFYDKERAKLLHEKFEDANIGILNDVKMDVMSVISMADIVIYSMAGTPNMMALMSGIPALCYYDYIDETPDRIMKHYLNELVFDDQEKLITRIRNILEGDESGQLSLEDKKKMNPFLDFKGLERLQSIVADIIYDNEILDTNHNDNRWTT